MVKALCSLIVVALILTACSGKKPSNGATPGLPGAPVVPAEPTLTSEIQNINTQLNQGAPTLSKVDFDTLSQEGVLVDSEDSEAIRFFIGE